ncbi:MAG: UbiA family prenyltransferase [Parasphingorhabdus sp.]
MRNEKVEAAAELVPLFVDVDGTLTRADVSLENFIRVARSSLLDAIQMFLWILSGRALAKAMAARRSPIDPVILPYRDDVLNLIKQAQAEGRPVILASASHWRNIVRIARHLDLSEAVIASKARYNCKGRTKLSAIREAVGGDTEFDYIGDSRADFPIWRSARLGWTAGKKPSDTKVQRLGSAPKSFGAILIKAMRPHQWAKNVLVFVPALTSGLFMQPATLAIAAGAAACMSVVASAIYLINDMLDIDADRAHRSKWQRPLAHGDLSIPAALGSSLVLASAGLTGAALLGGGALIFWFFVYIALTIAYSVRLKSAMVVDAITLAMLYTIRIWIGGVAIGVPLSFWLLLFSVFLFLSLSYLKRYIEMRDAADSTILISGRGYVGDDLDVVMASGVSASMAAILVLALFVHDPSATAHYAAPDMLLLLCIPLLYWINRIWMMARRGQVEGDPVAFALQDRRTFYVGGVMASIFAAALFGVPGFMETSGISH